MLMTSGVTSITLACWKMRKWIAISGNQPSLKLIDQCFCFYEYKQDKKKKSRVGISISKSYVILHNGHFHIFITSISKLVAYSYI